MQTAINKIDKLLEEMELNDIYDWVFDKSQGNDDTMYVHPKELVRPHVITEPIQIMNNLNGKLDPVSRYEAVGKTAQGLLHHNYVKDKNESEKILSAMMKHPVKFKQDGVPDHDILNTYKNKVSNLMLTEKENQDNVTHYNNGMINSPNVLNLGSAWQHRNLLDPAQSLKLNQINRGDSDQIKNFNFRTI